MTKEFKEDLDYFLNAVEDKRGDLDKVYPNEMRHLNFYFSHSKEQLNDFIKNYINNNKCEDKYDFYYMIQNIIKYMSDIYDAHTIIRSKEFRYLPYDLLVIDDEVFIVSCPFKEFNKSKVLRINGVDINTIIREMDSTIAYQTKLWRNSKLSFGLDCLDILFSLPSFNRNEILTFETDNGSFELDYKREYNYNYLSKEKYKIIDNNLIYNYFDCSEKCRPNIEEIDNYIKENNIDTFVLDLRYNSGGNSSIIRELINYLKASNLKLYTFVAGDTFSSGIWAALDMQNIGSKVVGVGTSAPLNQFGNGLLAGITPNYNYYIQTAKTYWEYLENENKLKGILTKDELEKEPKETFDIKYLRIDDHINYSKNDFLNDIDPYIIYLKNIKCLKK